MQLSPSSKAALHTTVVPADQLAIVIEELRMRHPAIRGPQEAHRVPGCVATVDTDEAAAERSGLVVIVEQEDREGSVSRVIQGSALGKARR